MRAASVATQPDQLKFYEKRELVELSDRVSREHYPIKGLKKRRKRPMLPEETPLGLKRKRRRAKPLTLEQKLEIVHRALVDGEAQKDLARDFRVTQPVISSLVCKVRKKPSLLAELISERAKKKHLDERLNEFIETRMRDGI